MFKLNSYPISYFNKVLNSFINPNMTQNNDNNEDVNLREAHGNKTLVLLQGARRASTPSPEGEEYEPFRVSS